MQSKERSNFKLQIATRIKNKSSAVASNAQYEQIIRFLPKEMV